MSAQEDNSAGYDYKSGAQYCSRDRKPSPGEMFHSIGNLSMALILPVFDEAQFRVVAAGAAEIVDLSHYCRYTEIKRMLACSHSPI